MPKGRPQKRYTPEFKKEVIETMLAEKLSYNETAKRFEISNGHRVRDWMRIYQAEGARGLAIERRGRKPKDRTEELANKAQQELLNELQRLRAENEYLKKLQALVMERERRQGKKPWSSKG